MSLPDRQTVLRSICLALVVSAVPVIQRLVLLPVYQTGDAGKIFAWVNRFSSMALLPGKTVVYSISPPLDHYFETSKLLVASFLNVGIYAILFFVVLRFCRFVKRQIEANREPEISVESTQRELAPSPERRRFLASATMGVMGIGAVATGTYPVFIEPGWLKVRRLSVPVDDLPPALDGLTIAQLSDIHHDEWISLDHVRDAVNLTNDLNADIVALTGDYVTSSDAMIIPVVKMLASLRPRIGTVGVLGNHDWWTDVALMRREFEKVGIPLIDNDRYFLTADKALSAQMPEEGLCLGGIGDLWEDQIDPDYAFRNVPQTMPRLLLSHNPDAAEHDKIVNGNQRIDLMLSGHTHGGQVRLPFVGTPVVPSAYGAKYVKGLAQGPVCRVHTSAGIGMALLPVRLNVPPEIVLVTLTRA